MDLSANGEQVIDYPVFIWTILTYNTEATENKVEGISVPYNNSLQLFELKKNNNKKIHAT